MIIIGATKAQLEAALEAANGHLHGNLRFKDIEHVKTRRDKREQFKVTLTVKDTNEIGSRRSYEGRRIPAACWHAHGVFFDNLPEGTEIRTSFFGSVSMKAGDKWTDINIGSTYRPLMASHACNCMDWNTSGVLPFPVNL